MTQEEKAKRYDELLLKLQKAKVDDNVCDERYCCVIDDIVPELKESDDERIRRVLVDYFKRYKDEECGIKTFYGIPADDILAWLEKQGENRQDPCKHCKMTYSTCYSFPCDEKKAFEQGKAALKAINEEKVDNANKDEPKIKIGDWVVKKDGGLFANGNHYVRITDIDKERYWFDSETWLETKYIRLWNISDAKDGDVLNSPSNRLIWIYKDNEHYHACVNMNYVTDNVATDDLLSIPNDACPATKDEQAILFARMKDAGYEWYADKKELKKIENETEIQFGAKDSELQEATYYIPKGFHTEIDEDKVVIKKGEKPTEWSEEDNVMIRCITLDLELLKNRDDGEAGKAAYQSEIEWLKSIKDRYTWKPSEEQLKVLDEAIKNPKLSATEYNILTEIEEQLKKLLK